MSRANRATRVARLARDDSGAMAILIAVMTVLLVGMGAIVVDLGMARATREDARKLADLAAFAGGQELPDTTQAIATVFDYLTDDYPDLLLSQLDDGNPANGEVTFARGDSGVLNAQMTVTTPVETIDFALAGAFPNAADSVDVNASATVELRQPIPPYNVPVLPVMVDQFAPEDQECLRLREDPLLPFLPGLFDCSFEPGPPPAPPLPVGYFDSYAMAKVGFGAQAPTLANLETSIAQSLDHQPGQPLNVGIGCSDGNPTGSITDQPPYTAPFTCATAWGSSAKNAWEDGLLGPGSSCAGRITAITGSLRVNGCPVTEDRWDTYTSGTGVSADIVSDPRFGLVMAFRGTTPAADENRAIRGYLGMYIRDLYVSTVTLDPILGTPIGLNVTLCAPPILSCSGDLLSAEVEFFEVAELNGILAPNTGVNDDYVANGPKTVVLCSPASPDTCDN